MNRIYLGIYFVFAVACAPVPGDSVAINKSEKLESKVISADGYELLIPAEHEVFLILFPGFPSDATDTKKEFEIEQLALQHKVAVLFMNFNRHLWLSEDEKIDLERGILDVLVREGIKSEKTFIGGFSSGGNIALLLSNYLKETNSPIQPKGVFVVDSPIDLLGLYENAQKNIDQQLSANAREEARWLVGLFESEFGIGDTSLKHYEATSPFLSKTQNLENLSHLGDLKIRFYSEPDTAWWRINRNTAYGDMNASYIEECSRQFNSRYEPDPIEYIQTENMGYRNGERHPHSWSIVDKEELIEWMKED
jgi:hypothetical protein